MRFNHITLNFIHQNAQQFESLHNFLEHLKIEAYSAKFQEQDHTSTTPLPPHPLPSRCLSILGGALEPFCHAQPQDPYQKSCSPISDACAKFCEFLSISSPSKTASCFMANNVSPWQQLLMKTQKLHHSSSTTSYNLADQILGGSS